MNAYASNHTGALNPKPVFYVMQGYKCCLSKKINLSSETNTGS